MTDFVHLHTHSEYSCLYSLVKTSELIAKAFQYEMPAVAITDIGNMYGVMEFEQAARAHNQKFSENSSRQVKPIFGIDLPMVITDVLTKSKQKIQRTNRHTLMPNEVYRLPLIAKNIKGYKNLCKLTSMLARKEGEKALTLTELTDNSEGLICLSGDFAGPLRHLLSIGQKEQSEKLLLHLNEIFSNKGETGFYLELQDHFEIDSKEIKKSTLELSRKLNIPMVATNSVCYVERNDWESHEVMLAIGDRSVMSMKRGSEAGCRPRLPGSDYHFRTYEEMKNLFQDFPDALVNTVAIAEMCELDIVEKTPHLPIFRNDNEEVLTKTELKQELEKRAKEGIAKKLPDNDLLAGYEKRLKIEIDLIDQMGFCDYFLIVQDFVRAAKERRIYVGPGRGSVVGSLTSYALSITSVDPMTYDLLFERFLNVNRVSLPDIDIDFQDDRRDEIIEYVKDKYGREQVCQIITFSKLKSKAAFKDVCRVFEVDFQFANEISSLILSQPTSEIIEYEDGRLAKDPLAKPRTLLELTYEYLQVFKTHIEKNDTMRRVFQHALKLENLTRQPGIHAAGVIISDKPLDNYIPLAVNDGKTVVSGYDGRFLESSCGLLKMDFLGLKTLSVIGNILSEIEKSQKKEGDEKKGLVDGFKLDIDTIPLDDQKTYQLFADGKTLGVFQFESDGMTHFLKELKPEKLEELIAMNALYRPGPMSWIPVYIAKKHNKKPSFSEKEDEKKYLKLNDVCERKPIVGDILKSTNLIPIYQEQIMELCRMFAGFRAAEADNIRQAISKKKVVEINRIRLEFISRAKKLGNSEEDAIFIYDDVINSFGSYGFNKSHSASYGLLAYQVAYLKAHYSLEFYTSFLNGEIDSLSGGNKFKRAQQECVALGIEICPPNINEGSAKFTIKNNKIVFGLVGIKNIGNKAVDSIVEERKRGGNFSNFQNFLFRMARHQAESLALNKQVIEALIKSGCFDEVGPSALERDQLLTIYPQLWKEVESEVSMRQKGQTSFFEQTSTDGGESFEELDKVLGATRILPTSREACEKYELEALGYQMRFDYAITFQSQFAAFKEKYKNSRYNLLFGTIQDVMEVKSKKNNKEMAIVSLNDGKDVCKLFCFSENWSELKNLGIISKNKLVCLFSIPLQKRESSRRNDATFHFEKAVELSEDRGKVIFEEVAKQVLPTKGVKKDKDSNRDLQPLKFTLKILLDEKAIDRANLKTLKKILDEYRQPNPQTTDREKKEVKKQVSKASDGIGNRIENETMPTTGAANIEQEANHREKKISKKNSIDDSTRNLFYLKIYVLKINFRNNRVVARDIGGNYFVEKRNLLEKIDNLQFVKKSKITQFD